MSITLQLARPMMRRSAGLDANQNASFSKNAKTWRRLN